MAGHSPDGRWQPAPPAGQDQVRVAWQPPPYEQPPYEQPGAHEAYPPPPQYQQAGGAYGVPPEDNRTRTWEQPGEPGQPGHAAQPGQPFQPPGQTGQPGEQAWSLGGQQAGWQQSAPGNPGYQGPASASYEARQRAVNHGKGFVRSLFDFGFTSFVTPKVIKGLYVLATAWTVLWAIFLVLVGNRYGHLGGALFMLIFVVPVFMLLTLGTIRVFLELFMALHRINENIQAMRDRGSDEGQ